MVIIVLTVNDRKMLTGFYSVLICRSPVNDFEKFDFDIIFLYLSGMLHAEMLVLVGPR